MSTGILARLAALLLSWAPLLSAQTAAIAGRVHVIGDTAAWLADVEITLEPGGHATRSDSSGGFRLSGLAAGEHVLRLRRLGVEPAMQRVMLAAGQSLQLTVALQPTAERMATITVSGQQVTYPARFADPYKRLARGTGRYFTRERIDSLGVLQVLDVLALVPGARVTDRGVEFARCRELSNDQKVQVWVDGNRWTKYNFTRTGDGSDESQNPTSSRHHAVEGGNGNNIDAATVLKDITVASIQLMEVYVGPSKIPGEYLDDACAVILIWTK
ncbi:MAG: carboxypeptidase regulatory-like domain-containing protein [Gemmatimonadaceae bacterium]|nr:carboxypeptidase regulatory-like domain-containing protein [Gemmatimonadaceae bacterium]